MSREIAQVLTQNIDEITRKWVDNLRLSNRTEVHKQLLSAEIVDGIKGMLANLAQTIEAGETPESESIDLPAGEPKTINPAYTVQTGPFRRLKGTRPLAGPLAQAQAAAAALGKLRHKQHYDIGEVIYEYVTLRHEVWYA